MKADSLALNLKNILYFFVKGTHRNAFKKTDPVWKKAFQANNDRYPASPDEPKLEKLSQAGLLH